MQNPNQFSQSVTKGQLDLAFGNNVISCQVDASQGTPLVAGQKVKLATTAGGVPKVLGMAGDTDDFFGIVPYNIKNAEFAAKDHVEIAIVNSVIYCEASAAITRGVRVMPVIVGEKIATATAGKKVVGQALDAAAADGDLIRVMIASSISDAIVL